MKKALSLVLMLALMFSLVLGVASAAYPERDVRVIIPWSVGGMTDVLTRPIANWLQEYFGVPFVVENKPGGGGVVGSLLIEAANNDGYVMGTTSMSTITAKYVSPTYPDIHNVDLVANVISIPATLTVSANSPWQTLEEYIADAKANPNKITTSHSGIGASAHIYTMVFENEAGIQTNQIPYPAYAEAVVAVIGGHVDATHVPLPDVAPQIEAGRLRLLAIASEERHPDYPDVPTFKERGINFAMGNYSGFVVPKGTPEEYRKALEDGIGLAMQDPKIVNFLLEAGFQPLFQTGEEFAVTVKNTEDTLNYLVYEIGIEFVDD